MREALVFVLFMAAPGRIAFAPAQLEPAFEVASIKRVVSPDVIYGIRPTDPSARFHAIITVHDLIAVAYGSPKALLESQVIGAPAWTRSERFEIVAKAPGAVAHDVLLRMLQTLLAERFELRMHKKSGQLPASTGPLDLFIVDSVEPPALNEA